MYLAREGETERERERELGMGCNGGCARYRGCVADRLRGRNMERKNERVLETDSFLRWLGEED